METISTEAWVLHSGHGQTTPGQLVKEQFTFADISAEDDWEVGQIPANRDPQAQIERHVAQYPTEAAAARTLLVRCAERLTELLRGLQNPLELLFPAGDASTVTTLYRDDPASQIMNQLVKQAILAAIAQLPAERGLRILEVGGGAGGTTAHILPALPATQTEYVFTDISSAFTLKAQEKFKDYPFVHYRPLDIEQAPAAQGFALHQYDIVVAANVLHATRDLQQTLGHIRQLLKPDGALVLLEGLPRTRWIDLTFGLTAGWWRFSDFSVRSEHPLLTASQWQTLLHTSGFTMTLSVPQDQASNELLRATVVVAQADPLAITPSRPWLIFADADPCQQGVGQSLALRLRAQGASPILVFAGTDYAQLDHAVGEQQAFTIDPNAPAHYQQLLQEIAASAGEIGGIVHLWSLPEEPIRTTNDLEVATQRSYGSALSLVQALLQAYPKPPALWLVTRGAQSVPSTASEVQTLAGTLQSGLWGMGRVIVREHPELDCLRVDLDGDAPLTAQVDILTAELMTAALPNTRREDQIALRQGVRHVARLVPYPAEANSVLPTEPFRLEITERGTLENLQLRPMLRQPPQPGELELRVRATGLNFRDLLNALGMYPGDPGLLGSDCAGEVVAVGAGVSNFAIGDRVVALAGGCFGQYVVANAALTVQMPAHLSFAEAAAIPSAFLTAWYGLHSLAKIAPGERVLIHAAAGGVGLAAVKLAQEAGAQVFATASPGKWEALKALGVEHSYHSRTLDFAAAIMADTDGQGVDIVLNSLTGAGFVEKNLSILAANGRFVEISKRDIWRAEQVTEVRPDVVYALVDLATLSIQEPQLLQSLLRQVMNRFAEQTITPLPYRQFPLQGAVQAFRMMQQAKHIGKIVITQPETQPFAIHADCSYLITGGLGGLGLLTARWLVEQGARHLVLLGRSRPKPEVQAQIDALCALGATITVAQADVTERGQVAQVLAALPQDKPLRGIVHAVGVLDDGALLQQSWARFAPVLAPKIKGAWNLHSLTRTIPLDFFVLFSSAAGLLGNQGQANHAAANVFLDTFAHYRRSQNLPALSIDWGAWSETGAAAALVERQRDRLHAQGIGVISSEQGMRAFANLLHKNLPQIAVMPVDWAKYLPTGTMLSAFMQTLTTTRETEVAAVRNPVLEQPMSLAQRLQVLSPEERRPALKQHIRLEIGKVLGLHPSACIDERQGLFDLGLDSLMAVELRNQLQSSLERTLPSTLLFDYPTIETLFTYLQEGLAASLTFRSKAPHAGQVTTVERAEQKQAAPLPFADEEAEATEALINGESIDDVFRALEAQLDMEVKHG